MLAGGNARNDTAYVPNDVQVREAKRGWAIERSL